MIRLGYLTWSFLIFYLFNCCFSFWQYQWSPHLLRQSHSLRWAHSLRPSHSLKSSCTRWVVVMFDLTFQSFHFILKAISINGNLTHSGNLIHWGQCVLSECLSFHIQSCFIWPDPYHHVLIEHKSAVVVSWGGRQEFFDQRLLRSSLSFMLNRRDVMCFIIYHVVVFDQCKICISLQTAYIIRTMLHIIGK